MFDTRNWTQVVTLDGTTPTTVTLTQSEIDVDYKVFVTCGVDVGSLWVDARTLTTFNVNTSGAHNTDCNALITR